MWKGAVFLVLLIKRALHELAWMVFTQSHEDEEGNGSLKMLHEGRFQLKGAIFGDRIPFYRMLIVALFFSSLCLFPFFPVFFTVANNQDIS